MMASNDRNRYLSRTCINFFSFFFISYCLFLSVTFLKMRILIMKTVTMIILKVYNDYSSDNNSDKKMTVKSYDNF